MHSFTIREAKARLNALAGLLEKVAAEGGKVDLYRLAADLGMDLDDMLPIVEAGEILGFLSVQEGDLHLADLGRGYADASILTRKELVAGRILRLPIIAWIYETLQRDDNRRVAQEFFLDALQVDFGDLAGHQLQVAVQWGRHAEPGRRRPLRPLRHSTRAVGTAVGDLRPALRRVQDAQ